MKFYYFLRNKLILLITTIFSPLLFVLAKRRWREYGDSPRILVIPQLTRIGDLVCATPVFRAIKEKHPKSFLAVTVSGKVAGIIKNNPYIDQIIQFKTKGYSHILKNVRILRFDIGISLTPQPVATATMLLGLIPRRIKLIREGRPIIESFTDWLNNETILYRHHTYLPQRYLDILGLIGISGASAKKEVFVSEEGEHKAEDFISGLSLRGFAKQSYDNVIKIIGISITAGNKIKEWGDDKFIELAKRIIKKYNAKIIFIGSKNDEPRIASVISLLRGLTKSPYGGSPEGRQSYNDVEIIAATDFTLEELPSLIKRLDLYIGVDTGPIYIADAFGTPLIDIIGPVDPTEQPPCHVPKSMCVLPPPYIAPTSFVLKRPGKNHGRALEATSVEMVVEAVQEILKQEILK